jgi:hypothetical protein
MMKSLAPALLTLMISIRRPYLLKQAQELIMPFLETRLLKKILLARVSNADKPDQASKQANPIMPDPAKGSRAQA